MKYKWPDTREKWSQIESELGVDYRKLEKACEVAALRIYPVFQAFNLEMGDRTPSLNYLSQVIFELAVGELSDMSGTHSWGGIVIESCEIGEEEGDYYAINISYHLNSIWIEDLKK